MENGKLHEFDTPENLLKKKGFFYKLVKHDTGVKMSD